MNKKISFPRLILVILFIFFGTSVFFSGKNFPSFKNIFNVHQFLKQIPESSPDYLGEIVSKEGNLLIIKYFEKEGTPFNKLTTKKERLTFLKNASIEEKITIGENLKQKVIGNITVLVPLNTALYLKKKTPNPITFPELKTGDFVIIWGNLNEKGQVVSDFIVSANPEKYEQK